MSHRRRFPCLALLLAAGCASDTSGLSGVLEELQNLPDASESMESAYRAERERRTESDGSGPFLQTYAPTGKGSVVAVWRDRLVATIDEGSLLPAEGSIMVAYNDGGYRGTFYVVRVRGRLALGQIGRQGARGPIEVGHRVSGRQP